MSMKLYYVELDMECGCPCGRRKQRLTADVKKNGKEIVYFKGWLLY